MRTLSIRPLPSRHAASEIISALFLVAALRVALVAAVGIVVAFQVLLDV